MKIKGIETRSIWTTTDGFVEVIDQTVNPGFDRLGGIDSENQVHPPLQIETEVDGIKGLCPGSRQ